MERENVVARIDPSRVRRIHLLGVCGTGMGSFAGMLAARGFEVTGSDENVYPPMSDLLASWGIRAMAGYRPENLDAARPDLVVVGNVIRRDNPEAAAVRARGLPHASFPAALGELAIGTDHAVVIVGTHGKTTTTALAGHLLASAGRDPSFLVGGVPLNGGANFRVGRGGFFVVEGDEYDTAYFDKGPKFLHYRPRTAVLTSLELDHADIYRDLDHYRASFERFVALLPADGYLAVSAAWPDAVQVARAARCLVESYAVRGPADWAAEALTHAGGGVGFDLLRAGRKLGRVQLPLGGPHNVENALGAAAAASAVGLTFQEIARGLAGFLGVRRRQEVRGEPGGILVVDDFAHHPTAVRETLAATLARFPGRPIWAIFEPRSNTSRRNLHQERYARAFTGAARAVIARPQPTDKVPESERLDVAGLVEGLRADGVPASVAEGPDEIVALARREARPGDLLLVMSNGSFGGLVGRLLDALR